MPMSSPTLKITMTHEHIGGPTLLCEKKTKCSAAIPSTPAALLNLIDLRHTCMLEGLITMTSLLDTPLSKDSHTGVI